MTISLRIVHASIQLADEFASNLPRRPEWVSVHNVTPPARSLAVVGAQYANKRGPTRRFELNICRPGEPIELRPEPKNPADERAIAVYSKRGIQLGYLTAERAPWIGGMLKQGREVRAIFQAQTQWGAWVRVAFDGEMPTLPPEREEEPRDAENADDPAPDFYPDDDWADE